MTWLRRPARRLAVALAAGLLLVSGCGSISAGTPGGAAQPAAEASAAASCAASPGTWTATEPASPGSRNNDLTGVVALAADNVWAVGTSADLNGGQTLIEHWNGATWSVITSPNPGESGNFLSAVSAVSPSDVWAVGEAQSGGESKTLIARWNATAWQQVPSPSPGPDSYLTGVRAVSARDAWAVGYYNRGPSSASRSLILHWNGTRWAQVPSPAPRATNKLDAVTAVSATSAWAVGSSGGQQLGSPFILHWNGTAWTQEEAPVQGTGGELRSVAATSTANVWAAGDESDSAGQQGLILHWNGTDWTRTPNPGPGGRGLVETLTSTAATSPANAWAVGYTYNGAAYQSLILRWNGTVWTQAASPNPGAGGNLSDIAASSPTSTWVVGQFGAVGGDHAFALRYCPPAADKSASTDLYTSRVFARGRQVSAAWLFKGPGYPRAMDVKALGKNGDQIDRLFTEPAELLVLQHCHQIKPAVAGMMDAYAHDARRPRSYMIIDGADTGRVLRSLGLLPVTPEHPPLQNQETGALRP